MQKGTTIVVPFIVWYLLELHQGHMDFQSIALPPELRYLALFLCRFPMLITGPRAKKHAKVRYFFRLAKYFLHFFEKKCNFAQNSVIRWT